MTPPPIDPDTIGTVTTYLDISSGDTYYGIEQTPYINEVEAGIANPTGIYGKYIELFNPYDNDIDLTGWKITGTTMPQIPVSAGRLAVRPTL